MRLRVAAEYGFLRDGDEATIGSSNGVDVLPVSNQTSVASGAENQDHGTEEETRAVDEMLTFINWVCDMHPPYRAQHNAMYGAMMRYLE